MESGRVSSSMDADAAVEQLVWTLLVRLCNSFFYEGKSVIVAASYLDFSVIQQDPGIIWDKDIQISEAALYWRVWGCHVR